MKLTNLFVFQYIEELHKEIINNKTIRFPAKVNYVIQKNYKTLLEIYQDLIAERKKVCELYHTRIDEDGSYVFEDSVKRDSANKELTELMVMEQEIPILKFDIESLGDMLLTPKQMEVLMFMINDGEE